MASTNPAVYCLILTSQTESVVFSTTRQPGDKFKVHVKNTAAPYDVLVVESWVTNDTEAGETFVYQDGPTDQSVSILLADLRHQITESGERYIVV